MKNLTKESTPIKNYQETKANRVSELVLVTINQDSTTTESATSEVKTPTVDTEESVKMSTRKEKESSQIDIKNIQWIH